MSDTIVVAALQMVSQTTAKENAAVDTLKANLAVTARLLQNAAYQGAQLVVLPENVLTFGSSLGFPLAQQQAWLNAFSALAAEYRLWLVAGSMPIHGFEYTAGCRPEALRWHDSQELPYATCVVFDDSGGVAGCYRKMHLFDADVADAVGCYRESDHFRAGQTPGVVATPWGTMGVGVCYDLRFPEYFRHLADAGVQWVVLPSAFTHTTGAAHWEILLRARAIENQYFVVGVNQGGEHSSGRKTWGDSMIVDAWGQVLARAGDAPLRPGSQLGEAVLVHSLDLSELCPIRKAMPVSQHRAINKKH